MHYKAAAIALLGLLPLVPARASAPVARPSSGPAPPKGEARRPPLSPPPPGVTHLHFGEFFVSPVGERGLALTPKLQSLDGKRVRLLGYMVRQEDPTPGVFLLAPLPVQLHEHEYGLADDLPPATVRVLVPNADKGIVPFTPRPLLLTGVLAVGNREEPDGRTSLVRLTLDPPAKNPAATTSRPKNAARERKPATAHGKVGKTR